MHWTLNLIAQNHYLKTLAYEIRYENTLRVPFSVNFIKFALSCFGISILSRILSHRYKGDNYEATFFSELACETGKHTRIEYLYINF
jgi:hypothetical protein